MFIYTLPQTVLRERVGRIFFQQSEGVVRILGEAENVERRTEVVRRGLASCPIRN